MGLARATVIDYIYFIRKVFVYWSEESKKIGGVGKVVEIDKATIGRRKYNKARYLAGQWVFGGIERGLKKFFLVAVEDHLAITLLDIVRTQIRHGTTIHSDC